jgi:Cof subfamily protein (haloacid dehalogenase superfamily)
MDYKLVMLDVDGTLIDETKVISPRVKTAIRQVQDIGVTVGLCTGRLAITCTQIVEELQLNSYGVYYSGALLKNLLTGDVLKQHLFPSDIAQDIVRFAREQNLYLEVHTENDYFYELQDSYSDFQDDTLGLTPIYTDILDVITQHDHDILKLQFVTESSAALEKINNLKHNNGCIELSTGKAPGYPMTFINVIPAGISKGSGVQEIAQAMGISLDQVIAVGDSVGDIEALEIAGLGVAMGNAEEELKQHADYIAASVWEDGVAQILERFLL